MEHDEDTTGGPPSSVADLVAAGAGRFTDRLTGGTAPDLVEVVAASVEPVVLGAGDLLFRQGGPADAAYFVVTGRVAALAERDGEQHRLRRMHAGEVFGEISLLDESPRTASIRAERDSVLARLPREAFRSIAADHPEFLTGLTRVVIRRLAHPRPEADRVTAVGVAVTAPAVDRAALLATLVGGAEAAGSVAVLGSDAGSDGSVQSAQRLDATEARHRFVVFAVDPSDHAWVDTVCGRADRMLVVMTGSPADSEAATISRLLEAGRAGSADVWLVVVDGTPVREIRSTWDPTRVVRVDPADPGDVERLARLATGTGYGLVLGGGGARGFAHLGVQRALLEAGIPIDAVAGTSIGAMFGAGIATGMSPDEITRITQRGFRRVLDYTLPMVAMIKGRRMARNIRAVFGDTDIEDLALPFLCVSSNLTTARPVVHDRGPLVPALRASAAIPGVAPPVPHGSHLLVDGGVLDNLPVEIMRDSGMVGTVIAVDVAPPVGPGAREDYGLSLSGWRVLWDRLRPGRRRYPRFSAVMMRSMIMGSMRDRDRMVAAGGADLYLDLDMRGTSLLDFSTGQDVVQAGYEAARPRIEEWVASHID